MMTILDAPAATSLRLLSGIGDHGHLRRFDDHIAHHGPLEIDVRPGRADDLLCELVRASGLGGRGGAMFPVARKVDAVRAQGGRAVVVINATEGEPASRKDHVLLESAPHLVIDGALVCAAMVGAGEIVIGIARGSQPQFAALRDALTERRDRDRGVTIHLELVPDGFVVGEERAVIDALNGGPGMPTHGAIRPFQKGYHGAPTLVQNAETAAQLAVIARHGADWFRSVGTDDEPGTVLVTLSGAVGRAGVYEIAIGTPLADLLAAAGGCSEPVSAFLIGGYIGTWIDAGDADGLRMSNADLRPYGAALGARAIVALPATSCGVAETARIARYMADQSAGQCGPCVYGLNAIAGGLERLVRGDGSQLADIERWCALVVGRGECRHPDGAASFVASALRVFEREIRRHVVDRRCAGTRTALLPVPSKGQANIAEHQVA
jgi:NADH:ubiquinone oxidoreductase subunit F (NADH-binding)